MTTQSEIDARNMYIEILVSSIIGTDISNSREHTQLRSKRQQIEISIALTTEFSFIRELVH